MVMGESGPFYHFYLIVDLFCHFYFIVDIIVMKYATLLLVLFIDQVRSWLDNQDTSLNGLLFILLTFC